MADQSEPSSQAAPGDWQTRSQSRCELAAPELQALRAEIDRIDAQLADLVKARVRLINQVGEIKERLNLPTADLEREKQIMARVRAGASDPDMLTLLEGLYEKLFELSQNYQINVRTKMKAPNP